MSSRREASKRFSRWISPDDRDKIRNKLQHTDWTRGLGADTDDFIKKTLEPIIKKFVEMKTSFSVATHLQSMKQVESLTKQNEQLNKINKKNVGLKKLEKDMEKYRKTVKEEREYLQGRIDAQSRHLTQYETNRKKNKKKIEELEAQNKKLQIELDAHKQVHIEQQEQIKNYERELYENQLDQFARALPPPADDEVKNDDVKPSANVINNALSENDYFDKALDNIMRVLNKDYQGRIVIHVQPKYLYGNFQNVSVHTMDEYQKNTPYETIFGNANDIQKYGITTVFPGQHNYPLATHYVLILFKTHNEDDFITNVEFLKDDNPKHDIIPDNLFAMRESDLIVLTWNKSSNENAKDVLDVMIEYLIQSDYVVLAQYLSHFSNGDKLYREFFEEPVPLVDDYSRPDPGMLELMPDLIPTVRVRKYRDTQRNIALLKNQIRLYISQLPERAKRSYKSQVDNNIDEKFLEDLLKKVKRAVDRYNDGY